METRPAIVAFRAKVETVYHMDGSVAWRQVRVPTLARKHCDMTAFRAHARFGGLANSDLFPGILARLRRDTLGGADRDYLRLDRLPAAVTVDTSGFLALVTIAVPA